MAIATRSRQSDRARNRDGARDRLLAAAERLFAEGMTFAEVSVERLCSEAGITRTTFYAYFADKADVLGAWFEAAVADGETAASAWLDIAAGLTREELHAALATMLERQAAHGGVLAAAYDASLFDATLQRAFGAMMDAKAGRLRWHIETGQAGGWIDRSLAAPKVARWLTWMIERGQHTSAADDAAARAALLDTYTNVIWNTLYAPAA